MATRMYLTDTATTITVTAKSAPSGGTAVSTWTCALAADKGGAFTTQTTSRASGQGGTQAAGWWVSPPLASNVTLTGTVQLVIPFSGTAAANEIDHFLWATVGDTNVSRATLASDAAVDSSATTMRGENKLMTLTSASLTAGDRLVYEHRVFINAVGGSVTTGRGGTGGTDLAGGGTDVSNRPGWVEFSQNLTFAAGDQGGFFF